MVSVCMATRNGVPYLRAQMESILQQLSAEDELIISDDQSTDDTISIIQSYQDHRIRLVQNPLTQGIVKNFEASLRMSRGSFIFLADQDDVWKENKVEVMMSYLKQYDLVISDCLITDHSLNSKSESFFKLNNSGKGLIKNILKNSYMGCCMAFSRKVLNKAMPFPKGISMHDYWIGLVSELNFRVCFIPEALVYHRRHSGNASTTSNSSNQKLSVRLVNRYTIVKYLLLRTSHAR